MLHKTLKWLLLIITWNEYVGLMLQEIGITDLRA